MEHVIPYPMPPGELLKEELEARGIAVDEAAALLSLTLAQLQDLFAGSHPLTPEIAGTLEHTLGTKAYIWNRLEARYRSELARQAALAEAGRSA